MCFVSVPVVWKLNLIKIYDMMISFYIHAYNHLIMNTLVVYEFPLISSIKRFSKFSEGSVGSRSLL